LRVLGIRLRRANSGINTVIYYSSLARPVLGGQLCVWHSVEGVLGARV
jgi:hypothetical protein